MSWVSIADSIEAQPRANAVRPLPLAATHGLDRDRNTLRNKMTLKTAIPSRCQPGPLTSLQVRERLHDRVPLSSEARAWPGINAHMVHHGPTGELALPPLADNVVVLRLSGSNRFRRRLTGDRPMQSIMEPGMINITPAHCESRHVWRGSCGTKLLQVFVGNELLARAAREVFGRDPAGMALEPRLCTRDPTLAQIGNLLLGELQAQQPAEKLFVESLANAFAIQLLRDHACGRKVEPRIDRGLPRPKLRRVVEYIEARLEEDISLEQLAQLAGYSTFHFTRLFKTATGRSPHRYVIEARIARARELLKDSSIPTAEIAYKTGFSSQSHFTTAFRKRVGVTPRVFRILAQESVNERKFPEEPLPSDLLA